MATIWKRGPRVRRNGVSQTKTFETKREAEDWARIVEGKVSGDEFIDLSKGKDTSLSVALDWYEKIIIPQTPRSAKGKKTQVAYWKASRFADWSLVSLQPWDLLDWRREALDEDNAEDGEQIGPDAEFGPQTCVHRLNLISHLYGQFSLLHRLPLDNEPSP